jgi:hypothetical protein
MEEVRSTRAVPLGRGRTARSAVPAPAEAVTGAWPASFRSVLAPPRLLWLAGLGSTAVTMRAARVLWMHLVAEGTAAEDWLRRTLGQKAA